MAKLTIEDLKQIKEKTAKLNSLRDGPANTKITVHMGTCGIAAGARDVMNANKMRQVFKRHVLLGEVQTDFALAKM